MNKRRKFFVRAICIFLALLMALSLIISVIPVLAVNQSQLDALESQKEELEEANQELQDNIDQLESEQGRYIDRKAALDKQIENNAQEIEVIQAQISLYDEQVEETRQSLKEALSTEESQYELLRVRMRAMEENGTLSYIAILLKATSLTDFLSRVADVKDIMDYDQQLQNDYIAAREDVQEINTQLVLAEEKQLAVKDELERKQLQLQAQTVAAYEMIADLANNIDEYSKAYKENSEEQEALQESITGLLTQLYDVSEDSEESPSHTTDEFMWPSVSLKVTKEYGWSVNDVDGGDDFHAGVDIGAADGTNVFAAADGTVVTADYNNSYGNYVLIMHNGGSATLYAHLSSYSVEVSDSVSRGDVIGCVGSTGFTTGPYLHFEVRFNGSTVNPLDYFSGYSISAS